MRIMSLGNFREFDSLLNWSAENLEKSLILVVFPLYLSLAYLIMQSGEKWSLTVGDDVTVPLRI